MSRPRRAAWLPVAYVRAAAWRLLAALLILLAWNPAAQAGLTASSKTAGLYGENESPAAAAMECQGVNARLLQAVESIPAQLLVRFGLEVLVEGGKKGAPARLDVTLTHPPLRQPGKAEPVTSRSWEVGACAGIPVLVAWTFLSDWELAPGEWTFIISHDGQELLRKPFQVVEGHLPEPEAQLSISLTPKPPTAAEVAAGGDSAGVPAHLAPAEVIAALASMRGLEPTVAAIAMDEAEAKRLAARSVSQGIPAVVRTVQHVTGRWNAVVVWDFTQRSADEADMVTTPAAQKKNTPHLAPSLAIQLAAYSELAEAQAYAGSLLQYGLQVFIESLQVDGRVLHTVRVGPFDATKSGRDQAIRVMDKLRTRGVRLPLLTRTPEPLVHPSADSVQPVTTPPVPAGPAAPANSTGLAKAPLDIGTPLPLRAMDATQSKLAELVERARPDETIQAATSKLTAERNETASDDAPDENAESDPEQTVGRRRGPERRPRNAPAVEEFAQRTSRGAAAMSVQIGPFKKRDTAEAFRKLILPSASAGTGAEAGRGGGNASSIAVEAVGSEYFVRAGGFANAQSAKNAGAEWIARHGPEAGLSAMVVKDEFASRRAPAGTAVSGKRPPGTTDRPETAGAGNSSVAGNATAPAAPARFVLQLASTASKDEAARLREGWAAKGLDARVTELPGALGRVYAVRAGIYPTMAAAQAAAEAVREAHGVLPVVVEEHEGRP
ncbi:DUF3859 domain-containing protein [Megalodesulfovibrio paquesii]